MNLSRHWQNRITLHRRWQRDQTPIQKQTKHKELSKPNTEHKGVYKKKIPNTQTKIKPSNPQTVTSPLSSLQRACCRRRRSPGCPSSQIEDWRTQIVLPLLRCSVLPLALPQGISLFFSLTLSQSLALYLTEIKKEMNRRSTS